MGAEKLVKKIQVQANQEEEVFSESSSSEESFLDESERSSLKSSIEGEMEGEKGGSVHGSLEGSGKASVDVSVRPSEGSKSASVSMSQGSSVEVTNVSKESSKIASERSSVEALETTIVEESAEDPELGNVGSVRSSYQEGFGSGPLKSEEGLKDKIFVNPFGANMESDERMLRVFLFVGLFPLPVVGWIIGLFSSLRIKRKKRIHKILTSILFLLTLVSIVAGMVILGYFLVKNSKDVTTATTTNTEEKKTPVMTPEQVKKELKNITDGAEKALDIALPPQIPGKYKPVSKVKLPKPTYQFGKPKNVFIPPENLQEPIPLNKATGDLKYEFFEYKHPSSKKEMVILLRGLSRKWREHFLFRFSDYVDHSIKVFNITENSKKLDVSKILTALTTEIAYKTNLGLVVEMTAEEIKAFEAVHTSMKINRLLVITPSAKCDKEELAALSGNAQVEFIGMLDKDITCSAGHRTPLMIIKNGIFRLTEKDSKLDDLTKYIVKEGVKCGEGIMMSEKATAYLDKVYNAFRKFVSMTSEEEKDQAALEAMCLKITSKI